MLELLENVGGCWRLLENVGGYGGRRNFLMIDCLRFLEVVRD